MHYGIKVCDLPAVLFLAEYPLARNMALTSGINLQDKIKSLQRAPPPKTPVESQQDKQTEFSRVKLKRVSNPEPTNGSTKNEEIPVNNNEMNVARKSSVREKLKMFDDKPPPPLKPKPKQQNAYKPAIQPPPKEIKTRPPSIVNKPRADIEAAYKDTRVPEASPVPPVSSLGEPPEKPPKLWSLKNSLNKYIGTSHPPWPTVHTKPAPKIERKPAMSPPVEAPPIPSKPLKTDVVKSEETNEDSQDEDFYDDTVGMQDPSFGEDMYEPVATIQVEENDVETIEEENYEILPAESESLPPALPPHTEKQSKEEKKRKEKEGKEKRKKEKDEKEKEEKERKKREKEKERKITDMKRRFSVRGNEPVVGTCSAAVDIHGNKMDISATIGEEFDVIRKDKTPDNKWLVRNKQGQYGFIDINNFENDDQGEDIYEEVSVVKESMQCINDDDIPAAPTTSPPPPPKTVPPPDNQEIYDDVATGEDVEELYEPLDN